MGNGANGQSTGGGRSFVNGGQGGTQGQNGGVGGFGGGGGAKYEGGGGGGFAGGDVVPENQYDSIFPESGAKSWNVGTDQSNTTGVNMGDGLLKVKLIQ